MYIVTTIRAHGTAVYNIARWGVLMQSEKNIPRAPPSRSVTGLEDSGVIFVHPNLFSAPVKTCMHTPGQKITDGSRIYTRNGIRITAIYCYKMRKSASAAAAIPCSTLVTYFRRVGSWVKIWGPRGRRSINCAAKCYY